MISAGLTLAGEQALVEADQVIDVDIAAVLL